MVACDRLRNRFGVRRASLAALHIGRHVSQRYQSEHPAPNVSALGRGNALKRTSPSSTNSRHVPLLDRLFAGPAEDAANPDLYGEFALNPDARIVDIANTYAASIDLADANLTLKEFLNAKLHGDIEVGDRVGFGDFDLIIRAMDQKHQIIEVGLPSACYWRREPQSRAVDYVRHRHAPHGGATIIIPWTRESMTL